MKALLLAFCLAAARKQIQPAKDYGSIKDGNVTLAWECTDYGPDNALFETGLEGTTNLTNWYELARLDYQTSVVVRLHGRPRNCEFYRAYTRWKREP